MDLEESEPNCYSTDGLCDLICVLQSSSSSGSVSV